MSEIHVICKKQLLCRVNSMSKQQHRALLIMNVLCVGLLRILDAFSLQARMDLLSIISYAGTMIMNRNKAVTSALDIIFVDTSPVFTIHRQSTEK